MPVMVSLTAVEIARRSEDAYSADRFTNGEWAAAAQTLLDRGYTEREAEAVLRSKATRWCRDLYAGGNEGKAEYLSRYIDNHPAEFTPEALAALVKGTF